MTSSPWAALWPGAPLKLSCSLLLPHLLVLDLELFCSHHQRQNKALVGSKKLCLCIIVELWGSTQHVCQGIARDGSSLDCGQWHLLVVGQDQAARSCSPQPGAGQARAHLGQPQPWVSGTSLGMRSECQPAGGHSLAGPMERAVVGLEMASYSPTGARTEGPRVWNGVLGHGQGGRNYAHWVHSGTDSGSVNILISSGFPLWKLKKVRLCQIGPPRQQLLASNTDT